ncbi:MAG: ATP-dependent helicase [Candidatus Pacebacteria bacterium]|nr:ATP-dependent helicase [Candidatus Paceibacterota bacterium]
MESKFGEAFVSEYQKLNKAQKEAVDNLAGPTMVVAGPGTGKTQVLAMRIANILHKTDIKADGILCLTFTNSAVEAMKQRLSKYIGEAGEKVNVSTFHSFGMQIIEKYYSVLGLDSVPRLLDETDTTTIFDHVLRGHDWEYLRPRADASRYFTDLKSLISLLKRERIASKYFLSQVEKDINVIESDEDNISTRGESKGKLKKEAQTKIEGLRRSLEVSKFFDLYEKAKQEKNLLDYDDVLENLVKIVEKSKDAVADIRERFLYVLVDEHQDSSRVQNEFLKEVWAGVEAPDIFVVGDDRQLIYGFSGASIDHFQGFKKTFKDAKLITLVDNYRSTQIILDASHALLQSVMTDKKLVSQSKPARPDGRSGGEHHPILLLEAETPEEEILAVAQDIRLKVESGKLKVDDCAILVPKNAQVRKALSILHQNGLAVSAADALNLFDQEEAQAFFRVLKIVAGFDNDSANLALSLFDSISGIDPLESYKYITARNMREFSLETALVEKPATLFKEENAVEIWINKIKKWQEAHKNLTLAELIELIGSEVLLHEKYNQNRLVSGKEILDTIRALVTKEIEKNKELTLELFLVFVDRLQSYGEHVPVVLAEKKGVKVMTLHSSKGLEFEYVWIAHMDERGLTGEKRGGFMLPEAVEEKIAERDVDKIKRKLYVAITRAKKFCTLSYARYSKSESEQELAKVISDLPPEVFERRNIESLNTENKNSKVVLPELVELVSGKYKNRYVSVSLLNNFFECPWKWYFRNLLQVPEEKSESLEFGSAVHEAIDQILKGQVVDLPQDSEIGKIISRWIERRLPDIASSRETEKSVSLKYDKLPYLNIYGKIDLVEYLTKDELRVTDFKTGSVRKKNDIEKIDEEGRMSGHLRQLAMYAYLLENSAGKKFKVESARLEFLEAKDEKQMIYDRVITAEETDLLLRDIADYDQMVKAGTWVDRPCNYNSYGKNTECEYCKMAEIYIR